MQSEEESSTRISTPESMALMDQLDRIKQKLKSIEDKKKLIDQNQDEIDHLALNSLTKMDILHAHYKLIKNIIDCDERFIESVQFKCDLCCQDQWLICPAAAKRINIL